MDDINRFDPLPAFDPRKSRQAIVDECALSDAEIATRLLCGKSRAFELGDHTPEHMRKCSLYISIGDYKTGAFLRWEKLF